MSASKEIKGNSLLLSTFLSYKLTDIIGHKTINKDGKVLVNFVWCKLCAKHKNQLQNSSVKGSAKTSALAFIDGTSSVTKHQVRISYFL